MSYKDVKILASDVLSKFAPWFGVILKLKHLKLHPNVLRIDFVITVRFSSRMHMGKF
jgi:hypothetical protein